MGQWLEFRISTKEETVNQTSRRDAIKTIGAGCALLTLPCPALSAMECNMKITLGIIADLHGGLATDAESRLQAFLSAMDDEDCTALVQLGDFAFPNEQYQPFVDKFHAAHEKTIHVIGNHDLDLGITKEDCQRIWGIENSYYATEVSGLRVVVLDGNETGSPDWTSGYHSFIGAKQLEWLESELTESKLPILILSHQPLAGMWAVDNAKVVQELLAKHHEKIVLCINGHSHLDALYQVEGVDYLHLNSASYFWVGGETRMAYYTDPLFSVLTIDPETSTIQVKGKTSSWRDKSPDQIGYFRNEKTAPKEEVVPAIRDRKLK